MNGKGKSSSIIRVHLQEKNACSCSPISNAEGDPQCNEEDTTNFLSLKNFILNPSLCIIKEQKGETSIWSLPLPPQCTCPCLYGFSMAMTLVDSCQKYNCQLQRGSENRTERDDWHTVSCIPAVPHLNHRDTGRLEQNMASQAQVKWLIQPRTTPSAHRSCDDGLAAQAGLHLPFGSCLHPCPGKALPYLECLFGLTNWMPVVLAQIGESCISISSLSNRLWSAAWHHLTRKLAKTLFRQLQFCQFWNSEFSCLPLTALQACKQLSS